MKTFYVCGDTHGRFNHIYDNPISQDENAALIILGDAGFNFYLNKTDYNRKKVYSINTKCTTYCVYGNHELRPSLMDTDIVHEYDDEVGGEVWYEPEFPNIKYFNEWGEYTFNGLKVLVIGGAYSVDKWYRLMGRDEDYDGWTGWFSCEQLTQEERDEISKVSKNKHYDLILSHTCPFNWQPTELFLGGLDQTTVDNSMELWMQKVADNCTYDLWLFGHYHGDMFILPRVEMYYHTCHKLDNVFDRWNRYEANDKNALEYVGLIKSYGFYNAEWRLENG